MKRTIIILIMLSMLTMIAVGCAGNKEDEVTNPLPLYDVQSGEYNPLEDINSIPVNEEREKIFTKAGLTITLTNRFHESIHLLADGYYTTLSSVSSERSCLVLKHSFTDLNEWGFSDTISVKEYAELTLELSEVEATITEADGLTYTEYSQIEEFKGNIEYSYFTTFYRGEDAYWVVEFYCKTDDYGEFKEDFIKYEKSVIV